MHPVNLKGTFYFEVKIDGIQRLHEVNSNPQKFTNVEAFIGDNHYPPADANVKNFQASSGNYVPVCGVEPKVVNNHRNYLSEGKILSSMVKYEISDSFFIHL